MSYRFLILLFSVCMLQTTSSGQGLYNDILSSSITKEKLSRVLLEKAAFSPVPRQDDQAWLQLDPQSKAFLVEKGEAYLNYDWPSLLARRYMDFDIDGNRTRYSSRYFERRDILADLCMAELAEGEGRFMDDIINGLWLILEESTWVVPAHSGGNKLHDKDDDYVDLFNAETAGLVAWIDYYFGESFDEITPLIRKRIYQEVKQRVIQPMLKHNDFWYMGYTGRIPNNWNPWIVSNWLSAVLLLEADQEVRIESCWKAMDVLDQYLNPHPADGGCDEGPSYWGHAGASLFDCLYLLNSASEGAIDVFDVPLIRNIGSYIYKINIANDWYVNFADGSAKGHHQAGTLYRVGQAIGDPEMMAFAARQYRHHTDLDHHTGGRSPFGLRRVPNLMILDEVSNFNRDFQAELNYFFPDLEVAVMREFKSQSGFFAAIKGGYNKESHNHNDAGSFVVFYNGLPLLIDVGVGTYSRKTFSDERYTIWTMQSDYHNLPTLNGEMQQEGAEFKAEKFLIENDGKTSTVSMELQSAYPDYAYTTFWLRSFSLNRKSGKVILVDSWEQERQMKRNQWNFMLAYEPEILDDGLVRITNGKDKLYLKFKKHFFPKIEEIKLDDSRLQNVWGPSVWRLSLSTGKKGLRGKEEFTIQSRR